MLESAKLGKASIRIYRWESQWVSLGANQAEISGIPHQVVRPTGGRAVLHGDDLTITVAMPLPLGDLGHFQLRALYAALMAPLQQALPQCRLPVRLGTDREGSVRSTSPDCFATTGRFDLCVAGTRTKIGGAALYTCESAALIQTSILIRNSPAFGDFPARSVQAWDEHRLANELLIAWRTCGWDVVFDQPLSISHT